jgi:hypothetical protein
LSDFVNANETINTLATMTIKELQSVTSGNGEESGGSDEEADKEPVVSRFVEEVSSLKYF